MNHMNRAYLILALLTIVGLILSPFRSLTPTTTAPTSIKSVQEKAIPWMSSSEHLWIIFSSLAAGLPALGQKAFALFRPSWFDSLTGVILSRPSEEWAARNNLSMDLSHRDLSNPIQEPLLTTYVSGVIDEDTVWNIDGSPYVINGNLSVSAGVTLTVEPGVVVKLGSHLSLTINGSLVAQGQEGNEIAFGDQIIAVPEETDQFYSRETVLDYREGVDQTWWVDITIEVDTQTGLFSATFRTLDPETEDLPEDPFAGFLPPNDDTGRGEAHISFSIQPKTDRPFGTEVTNAASIVFDTNDPILTNNVLNTLGLYQVFFPIVSNSAGQ
jgi:hypothetical protein